MRSYGKKDSLSVIGFAGIIVMNETQADGNRYVAEALAGGVNYFDVLPPMAVLKKSSVLLWQTGDRKFF